MENASPEVHRDLEKFMDRLAPPDLAKVMASVMTVSATTQRKRDSVDSWRKNVRIIRPFAPRLS